MRWWPVKNLFFQKRYFGFFWTQFFGAFNDNIFKNALVILIAFKVTSEKESGLWINLASGLFILPFFLFSPYAGQLADKYSKPNLILYTKWAELFIVLLGGVGFLWSRLDLLLFTLFLMGTHSAFFGPLKYSLMPQALKEHELVEGTALVEMATFVAILLGTLLGGILVKESVMWVSGGLLVIAVLGILSAYQIPPLPSLHKEALIQWNPLKQFSEMNSILKEERSVKIGVYAISWFWFYGATILAQLPNFVKHFMNGSEHLITLLLAVFTVSIALGSLLCSSLTKGVNDLGLVPIGAIGMSVFLVFLSFVDFSVFQLMSASEIGLYFDYPVQVATWTVLLSMFLIGVFGGFFTVPLYALLQQRSQKKTCSQVIAANNVYNALFMVGSAVLTMLLYSMNFNVIHIFKILAGLNLLALFYGLGKLPEFSLKCVAWLLTHSLTKLKVQKSDLLPSKGGVLMISNHVSLIDWFILSAASERPIRFLIHYKVYQSFWLKPFCKLIDGIAIASEKENSQLKQDALICITNALQSGEVVCVFPEGKLTSDGELADFKSGYLQMLERVQVPLVPVGLNGLWGSVFSLTSKSLLSYFNGLLKRQKVLVRFGDPLPGFPNPEELKKKVGDLLSTI
jgi:1-acyl-sn-glycerol-3-phosphate acyltransferase